MQTIRIWLLAALGLIGGWGSAAWAQSPEPVTVRVTPQRPDVAPGERLAIAVELDHAEGYHTWPSADQDVLPKGIAKFAIRTEIVATPSDAGKVQVLPVQWPAPGTATVPNPAGAGTIEAMTYQGSALAFIPVIVAEDAAGTIELRIRVAYQACDEKSCLAPEESERVLALPVVTASGPRGVPADASLFAAFDAGVFERAVAAPPEPDGASLEAPSAGAPGQRFIGIPVPRADSAAGIAIIVLLGGLGGFILNLTPCVLPVIPIKVLTLSQHAKSPGRALYLGGWMFVGVVAFWFAVGLPLMLFNIDPSMVFGIWWVTTGIGVVIALMALGLLGFFQVTLPQSVYMVNPKADTGWGSFVFGIMTAVLGLPCFGFVVGALLPATAGAPRLVILAIFASLGVGMGLPYFVLAAFPRLVDKIPRTGPASELVKQVMALLLLAAAVYFIGSGMIALVAEKPYLGRQLHWWVVALCGLAAGVWLAGRTFTITRRPGRRFFFTLAGAALAILPILWAVNSTSVARHSWEIRQAEFGGAPGQLLTTTWIDYTPELFERARRENYVVVLDFTAEWCLICKSLKAAVLYPEPVKSALRRGDVVTMTVDCTSLKAPGWKMLADLGQTGIPTLAIYAPGKDAPWVANSYTAATVLDALDAARTARELAIAAPK